MYHLSKELAGIVLPADTYGTHLKDGKTVDEVLEEKNFKAAGEVLAEVWSNLIIDDHPVTSEYVEEKPSELITNFSATPAFKSRHLIQTQYMTIALKCDDPMCCSPPKTIIHNFFPGRRVPALIPFKLTGSGPKALPLSPDVTKEALSFLDVFQRLAMEDILMPEQSWKMSNLLHGPISTNQILPREKHVSRDIFGASNLQNRTYGVSCDE